MVSARTHYEVLDVSPDATATDIRRKYKLLTMAWHPDRFDASLQAEAREKMVRINAAYAVLRDIVSRRDYDAELAARSPEDVADRPKRRNRGSANRREHDQLRAEVEELRTEKARLSDEIRDLQAQRTAVREDERREHDRLHAEVEQLRAEKLRVSHELGELQRRTRTVRHDVELELSAWKEAVRVQAVEDARQLVVQEAALQQSHKAQNRSGVSFSSGRFSRASAGALVFALGVSLGFFVRYRWPTDHLPISAESTPTQVATEGEQASPPPNPLRRIALEVGGTHFVSTADSCGAVNRLIDAVAFQEFSNLNSLRVAGVEARTWVRVADRLHNCRRHEPRLRDVSRQVYGAATLVDPGSFGGHGGLAILNDQDSRPSDACKHYQAALHGCALDVACGSRTRELFQRKVDVCFPAAGMTKPDAAIVENDEGSSLGYTEEPETIAPTDGATLRKPLRPEN